MVASEFIEAVEKKMTEAQHQREIFQWAARPDVRLKYPEVDLLFHIANEGNRSKATGAQMKAQGLKSGVPDLCLPVPRGQYGCLFIELKKMGGKTRKAQEEWIKALNEAGCFAEVCHGWRSAVRVIEWYLNLNGGQHGTERLVP